jgi:hypothetical protein
MFCDDRKSSILVSCGSGPHAEVSRRERHAADDQHGSPSGTLPEEQDARKQHNRARQDDDGRDERAAAERARVGMALRVLGHRHERGLHRELDVVADPDGAAKAQNDINFMRLNLEKLRSTCRQAQDMADRAIKFGDDVSSIHGAMGLAWQSEKQGILKTVVHLKDTCKTKYEGMMTGTEKAVREMDTCEAEFFNNRDWYDRYGFLYYQFLRARYEPEK